MRIKKGEKGYGGIVCVIVVGFLVWIILREKGFVFTDKKTGEKNELSKLRSAFVVLLSLIPALGLGFLLKFGFLKTNDFICKYCKKEYGASFETEKEVCKTCYEKRRY